MRKTSALASGGTPRSYEQDDGLAIANQMLDAWSAERLMIFSVKRTTHALIASHNPHTIGTGGDINTDRPVKIENAGIIVTGQTSEVPMYVAQSMAEYAAVRVKTQDSSIPRFLYYDPAFPLGNIYLAPIPNPAPTLVLYRWTPLSAIATVNDTVVFPPGYEEAFDANLAVRLAADGMGVASEDLKELARSSKARLEPLNVQVPILQNDATGVGGSRQSARSNIYTNTYR